jgi:predicted MFS family arabinose efflux permease
MTLGYVMVNKNCGHKARGSVMGINCLFGAIAILIVAKGGGLAFDHIHKNSPFLGAAILSGFLLIINIIPGIRRKLDNKSQ